MNKFWYPFFIWRSHKGLILFSIIFVAIFQILIIKLVSAIDLVPVFSAILKQLPPLFRMLFSQEFMMKISLEGIAAFGLNHPTILSVLAIVAIMIPSHHIAGEIENGTLELLIAHPIERTRLIIYLWLSVASILLFVIGGALIGSLSSIAIYHEFNLEIFLRMLKIGTNLWILFVLIMSYTLLVSTFGREGGRTGIRCAGITLVFYLLNFLSALWKPLRFTKPINIFTYYQPQKLMFEERSFLLHFLVLSGLICLCLIGSILQFRNRDIP